MKHLDHILKDALIEYNLLTASQVQQYLSQAQLNGHSLKDTLLSNEILNDRQITIALAQHLNLEIIDFTKISVDKSVIEVVPVKFVWYYKFMPVSLNQGILTIASFHPFSVRVLDEIRMHLGMPVRLGLTSETDLINALKKYYGLASDTIDKILSTEKERPAGTASLLSQEIEDIEQKTDDPTVSQLVNEIILEAYKKRATDIHIEPYRGKVRFRYRIDGVLVNAHLPETVRGFLPQILSRIKILANLSITEKRLPQDGSAVVKVKEQQLDLRVSTMPTPHGESMVVRVLPTTLMLLNLEKLGFNEEGINKFRDLIRKPHGIIFITGPTGSGKTTTLYACLNEINGPGRKIITIEDPVEYEMDGITQIQVNPKINFDFSTGLRSILRHDPDIIMVGEVRDLETAEIAVRTALTGHLVFSTLHTNDAASAVTRLIDMGIEPYLVVSSVEAFVAQRLVRMICPKCKEEDKNVPEDISLEMKELIKIDSHLPIKFYRGKGCEHCNNTGFYGRMAIYEILEIKDNIRMAILNKSRSDQIKHLAIQQGMITLRQNGWKAVHQGLTTPDEVLNVTIKDDFSMIANNPELSLKKMTAVPVKMQGQLWHAKRSAHWQKENLYDARVYPRVMESLEIRYQIFKPSNDDSGKLVSEGIEYKTQTIDISAGGIRFIAKDVLPIDTILGLQISLPSEVNAINCLAKVCRVEQESMDQIYTVVNYYLDLTSADRAAISRYVRKKVESHS